MLEVYQGLEIQQSYTSVLLSASFDGSYEDKWAYDSGVVANKPLKINKWFYEPLKEKHYLKLVGRQGKTFSVRAGGEDEIDTNILTYSIPNTLRTVTVRNEQQFIDTFDNLQSNTTVVIMPGVYRIQQSKQHQHTFSNLENIVIKAKGAIVSGFKAQQTSSVASHQTQAFGLKDGVWKRMNPKNPVGPGANFAGSVDWTHETIDESNLLGFMVDEDGSIYHNATGDIKVSNSSAPNLWRFTHCKNIHIQDLTVEGYNSVYPNSSALGCVAEIQGCENIHFLRCKFDRNGGAIISALNTARICNLIWLRSCIIQDNNEELTYMGMRHSGHTRSSGLVYFNNAKNCSVFGCKFIGNFYTILDINGVNNDYVSNYFEKVRNHPLSVHGATGYGFSSFRNTFFKCGNPLPANEERAQVGPSFWFNNVATESGWNGEDEVLSFAGTSGGVSQGNRLGGTSTERPLGGMHVYDNSVQVTGVGNSADTITTIGLNLADHAFSRLVVRGNRWTLTNTGARTANVVRHFESGGLTTNLANNLATIEWSDNVLEWDRISDEMVYFGLQSLTHQEFIALLNSA
jgi:hypothetical protein